MVTLAVCDSGCGMPQEDMERAFQPFFTTKAIGKGTGLGLFLSREAVVAHGGQLLLESEVGSGDDGNRGPYLACVQTPPRSSTLP